MLNTNFSTILKMKPRKSTNSKTNKNFGTENLRGSLLQNQGSNNLKHIIVMKSKKLYRIHSLGESLAV